MAGISLPYVTAHGNITKALQKIQAAQVPPRFTSDYLATKLDMKGGSARPVIPFFKRLGLLASDGTPTDVYRRFRNPALRGAAAAEALRTGYRPLFEINEYVYELKDADLKGLVVQVTGSEPDNSTVGGIVGSFKAVRAFADFEAQAVGEPEATPDGDERVANGKPALASGFSLGYTINLHLPATSDVAVFNAIFKSLRDYLLE